MSDRLRTPFEPIVEWLGYLTGVIELLAIVVLLLGAGRFLFWMVRAELFSGSGDRRLERQNLARLELGRYILAGLELLIVADVIHTALTFDLDSILFLGALVLIRSVISFFLDREIAQLERKRQHDAPE
ncbi:MAG: DUF1622 domain-containing protein [Rhizobiaceae bacterium]